MDEIRGAFSKLQRERDRSRRNLRKQLGQLNWRFTERLARQDDSLLAAWELNHVLRRRNDRARVAFITTLPPDETGIAIYSYRFLAHTAGVIDVFSAIRDVSQYLRHAAALHKATGGKCVLHPISGFEAHDVVTPYRRVVFVVGNSLHNVEVYKLLIQTASKDELNRCVCYLHDPSCLHITRHGRGLDVNAFRTYLERIYGRPFSYTGQDEWKLYEEAVKAGLHGPRALTDAGVRHFIVNSYAAADLVRDDIAPGVRSECRISTLFLPIYRPDVWRGELLERRQGVIRVGTFGVPGREKRPDLVVSGVERWRSSGANVELLMAGYGAKAYLRRRYGAATPAWIVAAEPPTEAELQSMMRECDVAVQLRARSMGESSGVIPALINLGVPTLVSPVGAFRDYGDAVKYFHGEGAEELADSLSSASEVSAQSMAAYASRHRPKTFDRAFFACLALEPRVTQNPLSPAARWVNE